MASIFFNRYVHMNIFTSVYMKFCTGDPLHRSDACEIPCESSKIRVAISEELERKLMQVICSCPGGVILDDFETIYSVCINV